MSKPNRLLTASQILANRESCRKWGADPRNRETQRRLGRKKRAAVKADPLRYQQWLEKQRRASKKRYAALKNDPVRYAQRRAKAKQRYERLKADPIKLALLKTRSKAQHYKSVYGLSLAERDALFNRQGNKCAVCETQNPSSKHPWHLDHEHASGRIRGIICHHCNIAAGAVKDSPYIALRLAGYLQRS